MGCCSLCGTFHIQHSLPHPFLWAFGLQHHLPSWPSCIHSARDVPEQEQHFCIVALGSHDGHQFCAAALGLCSLFGVEHTMTGIRSVASSPSLLTTVPSSRECTIDCEVVFFCGRHLRLDLSSSEGPRLTSQQSGLRIIRDEFHMKSRRSSPP